MTNKNYFADLAAVNVGEYIERKGQFSYLSWPYAVAQLRLFDETATWTVERFDGLPYLTTDYGTFVEVAVTVRGVTLSQIHPVLDARNKPLLAPSAFDINTSIQRCLVKAIALHGLGLYIYAGEDLPEPVKDEPPTGKPDRKVTKLPRTKIAVSDTLTEAQQAEITRLATEVGADLSKLVNYFQVEQLADIKAADYPRVIKSLEKRRAA